MKELVYGLAALVLFGAIYFGGYFAMLEPVRLIRLDGIVRPAYRFGGDSAAMLFRPAFLFDQLVRPDRWRPGAASPGVIELDIRSIRES